MNLKKYMVNIFIIFFAFILIFCIAEDSYAYQDIPQTIKIGLYFEKSAVSSININSQTGFEIGYEKDGQFASLIQDISIKNLIVRKDTFFTIRENVAVEYSPNDLNAPQGKKYGPYHIQIGGTYPNYDLTMQQVESLKQKGIEAFPAFINGSFKVWTGLYTSEQEAQNALVQVKQLTNSSSYELIMPGATRVQVLLPEQEVPKLIFDDTSISLFIQPLPNKDLTPLVNINGKKYRGGMEFKRFSDSDMTVINVVDFEQYLYGVLPREMGGSWPLEALKAQAVAARTYAVLHMNKYLKYGFNLDATTASQVYGGFEVENPNCTRAVEETRGEVLTYKGKPAYIYYFSTSGGHTEDIRNVWGGSGAPYLIGVEDTYEPTERADRGIWTVEMTPERVKEVLKVQNYDLGEIISIKPVEYSTAGRVIKLKIVGTKGEYIFEKQETRTIFGAYFMNSQHYTVSTDSDIYISGINAKSPILTTGSEIKVISRRGITSINPSLGRFYVKGANTKKSYAVIPQLYTFNGRGWGHGVGLSQWGARGMAENGFKYDEILTHYFPGTQIQ
jgi:stage II sporulation protein D